MNLIKLRKIKKKIKLLKNSSHKVVFKTLFDQEFFFDSAVYIYI